MTTPFFPPAFLDALDQAVMQRNGHAGTGGEVRFRCPAEGHPDVNPSARWNRAKAVWCCDACTAHGGAFDLADRLGVPRPTSTRGEGVLTPGDTAATPQQLPGCSLQQYAEAKQLPLDFLRQLGLSTISYQGVPAVRIPYRTPDGQEAAVRFRVGLAGSDRFRWRSKDKAQLYGQERLVEARERGYVILVEGESDCHTLWYHGEPAIGLPGAGTWKEERDAPLLEGIGCIYVVIEPDSGGEAVRKWLERSAIRERVALVDLGTHKDPSSLHLAGPDEFFDRWRGARAVAVPWAELADAERHRMTAEAWQRAQALARTPNIVDRVADDLAASGVAGERRTLKLLYLILTSRFLERPVSAAIKGPSSGGKSYTLDRVLQLFPHEASYALSAMSERALAYGTEPLSHRFLILYEAAGLSSDFASYLMRSLLSEGRVRYETVEKTKDGELRTRLIEREGPTGLLVTTTAVQLHPENETRLLSIPVTDTPAQTRHILRAIALDARAELDPEPWHALQVWLAGAEHRVVIPYAMTLSDLVPPVAVRLRRDFGQLLSLIRTHAILHQASRDRDEAGRIVATLDDYAAVRSLIADLVAEGVGAMVPPSVRETVETVRTLIASAGASTAAPLQASLLEDTGRTLTVPMVAGALGIDKSSASRRISDARERGYLHNLETRQGRPAKIVLGEPLPEEVVILPEVTTLAECCTVAVVLGEDATHSPPVEGSPSRMPDRSVNDRCH